MRIKWLDDEGDILPGSRMTWLDLGIMATSLAATVIGNVATALDGIKVLLQQHHNYLMDRDEFHEEATFEIESLMEGDSDG